MTIETCKQWNTVWLPFYVRKCIDPFVYFDGNDRGKSTTATHLANAMAEVHLHAASNATAKGKVVLGEQGGVGALSWTSYSPAALRFERTPSQHR